VVVIAGTGNNCRGRDRSGREGRITGEGIQFGEYGGGGEIVFKAIQSVAYAWTQRGPQTALTALLIHLAGAESLPDLIEGIDLQRYIPDANWALAVFQAASSGDPVARELIAWSARELGESACAVIRQLGMQGEIFDVVMVGSVFEGGDLYIHPLRETIQKLAPGANLIRLKAPPVVGGVVLAMQKTGLKTGLIHERLIETTRRMVQAGRGG
jgi:N-acetylglucosamine kinase-like BadF-type ATPase